MLKLKKYLFIITSITLLYLVINQACFFVSNIEGKYILHSDGNCHLLPVSSDTLILKKDGLLSSRNFSGNPVYEIKLGFFEKKIKINFNDKKESIILVVERNVFGIFKIKVCMDQNTYYVSY